MPLAKKAEMPSIPRTECEVAAGAAAPEKVEQKRTIVPVRAGFGQPLTEWDLLTQRTIGVAGIVQAVIQSPSYTNVTALLDEDKIDAYLLAKAKFWLAQVRELAEAK